MPESSALPVTIPDPCDASWDGMVGDAIRRRCARCDTDVHAIDSMASDAVARLVASVPRPCVRARVRAPLLVTWATAALVASGCAATAAPKRVAVAVSEPAPEPAVPWTGTADDARRFLYGAGWSAQEVLSEAFIVQRRAAAPEYVAPAPESVDGRVHAMLLCIAEAEVAAGRSPIDIERLIESGHVIGRIGP